MRSFIRPRPVIVVLGICLLASPLVRGREKPSPRPKNTGGTEVKFIREWSGSVMDESLQKEAPAQGFITDAKTFARLWRVWQLGDQVAEVDFPKALVLVETTQGSRLRLSARLAENGDLRVLGLATRDFRPGFRYHLAVVPRAGVKAVNGNELPGD